MNEELFGAVSRGYCAAELSNKILDPYLVNAIVVEIEKLLSKKESNCLVGTPKVVNKPWGKELWLEINEYYCYKRIYLNAGCRTSLQYHNFKQETNYVIAGKARVLLGDTWHDVKADDYFTIKPGVHHRVEAITDLVLQEVSTPHVSDVVRIEDDTNRPDGHIESEHNNEQK